MFRFSLLLTILLMFIRVLKNGVLAGRLITEGAYMNYKHILSIAFLLIAGIITSAVADEADWMPDANLRQKVRAKLGLDAGAELTQAQMTELTKLWATDNNISDLTGLEHATNLTQLSMWKNDISDLTPIQGLTQLTFLNINHNDVSDISALSGLTALTRLNMKQNNIVDVSPLLTLVNLNKLIIEGNPLTNAHLLSQLTDLNEIDIDIPEPPVVDTPPDPPKQVLDTTPPGISISVPEGIQNRAFDVTITFSESVSDFVQDDLSLEGSTAAATITAWSANTDKTVYTATITPTTSGEVILNIAADVATDIANNPNTAAIEQSVSVDVDSPSVTLTLSAFGQGGNNNRIDIQITFTEPVEGFEQTDLSVTTEDLTQLDLTHLTQLVVVQC